MKHFYFCVFLLMSFFAYITPINAQKQGKEKYQLMRSNFSYIRINGEKVYVGSYFNDTANIQWVHPKQYIKVRRKSTGKYERFYAPALKKKQAKSIFSFLYDIKYAATRGTEESQDTVALYLCDTVLLPIDASVDFKDSFEVAIFEYGDKKIETPIVRTSDGRNYIISNEIYQGNKPIDGILSIEVRIMGDPIPIHASRVFWIVNIPEWIDDEDVLEED